MVTQIAELLSSPWMLALVMVSIILDVFVPVLPSGSLLIVAVVYAGKHDGTLAQMLMLFIAGAVASTIGDNLAYRAIRPGAGPAHRLLARMPRVAKVNETMRETLRARPKSTMTFARLIPTGRTLATAVAATDPEMPRKDFQTASAVAAVVWAAYTVAIGYLNALLFETGWVSVAVGVAAAFAVGTVLARSRRAVALTSP
ncbi:VTT domain-containing protein [Phytomonospora sp. NPDC050363]|uniref:DedA family protein n=1 Tax=Phytomonospora sp. NPDC050363 TaxID=3155642 RepID=UPI0033D6F33F